VSGNCKVSKQYNRAAKCSSHKPIADISTDLIQKWTVPCERLPEINGLPAFIQGPLPDLHKIPISQSKFNELLAQTSPRARCTPDVIQSLFRVSEGEKADAIWDIVNPVLVFPPPDQDSTESSFHKFWDQNIRQLFDTVIQGRTIRDSNESTSTALFRPDFGLLINKVCAFRGEEKAPGFSGKHPKQELFDKLTWTYDPAPYILGW
jgi:hypothetical protein